MLSLESNYVPFFSIIICTYNRTCFLERALKSLIKQKESDWECIIIDDGSYKPVFDIIQSYIEEGHNIRYIYHKNKGLAHSRNAGILAASGLFITFLDDDDEYKPYHLKIRKKIMIQNPEIDLLYSNTEIIGNPLVPDNQKPDNLIHIDDCKVGGTFVFPKSTAYTVGGFQNLAFADDLDFYQRVVDAGFTVGKTEERTYIYHRDHENTICNNKMETS